MIRKAMLTSTHVTSIPRLELCAAVLAVEIIEVVKCELMINFNTVKLTPLVC
jgi:hypothetical protein